MSCKLYTVQFVYEAKKKVILFVFFFIFQIELEWHQYPVHLSLGKLNENKIYVASWQKKTDSFEYSSK